MKCLASNRAARFGIASHAGPRNPSGRVSEDRCAMRSNDRSDEHFMNVRTCAKSLLAVNAGAMANGHPSICENTRPSIAPAASDKIGVYAERFRQDVIPCKRGLLL